MAPSSAPSASCDRPDDPAAAGSASASSSNVLARFPGSPPSRPLRDNRRDSLVGEKCVRHYALILGPRCRPLPSSRGFVRTDRSAHGSAAPPGQGAGPGALCLYFSCDRLFAMTAIRHRKIHFSRALVPDVNRTSQPASTCSQCSSLALRCVLLVQLARCGCASDSRYSATVMWHRRPIPPDRAFFATVAAIMSPAVCAFAPTTRP